jgi:transposase
MPGDIAANRLPISGQSTTAHAPATGQSPGATPMPRPLLKTPPLGDTAQAAGRILHSHHLGLLPILNRLLTRLHLESILRDYLPPEDRRSRIATAQGLMVLLKNLLLSRQPLYGVPQWAARCDPAALGLVPQQFAALNDDRIGRCLDQLFRCDCGSLALAVATKAVAEFDVELDELHNDSTTVTFSGAYLDAAQETKRRGQTRLAITWGHNKDHRPDLKQLLFILTVAKDGGVPVYFQARSGNVVDDRTHRATWDLLCKLTGRRDFLYVADCKLASTENMAYVHGHGGRFLTVLPRTRSEDRIFRAALAGGRVHWRWVHDKYDEEGKLVDRYRVSEPAATSAEGYRLEWYHSTRKAELDALARTRQLERTLKDLAELQQKLTSPRTRYRRRAKVTAAVEAILQAHGTMDWIELQIDEYEQEIFRQERRGRPNDQTTYRRQVKSRFELRYALNHGALAAAAVSDGIFPLITNDRKLSEQALLVAYKGQPVIEKRFEQLKTEFEVAPVFLKEVSRIQALLCLYFLVLLVQALLERELRRAMARHQVESLPLYPEGRACRHPTTPQLIELFENVQRHVLVVGKKPPVVMTTKLSELQRRIVRLLGMRMVYDN